VRVIVDANIVFSALLNTNGKIADILIKSKKKFQFIAPEFLRLEIKKHHKKIAKLSGLSMEQIGEAEFQIYHTILFISEEQISEKHWNLASLLTHDVDPKDTPYVAYAKHFKCKIWSGDKELIKGLAKKGFTNFVTTNELYELRDSK
jgi:predicted nucleic acid-binding protein